MQNPEARTNPAPFRCMLLPYISQLACALVPSRESQMTHCMDASKIAADRPAEVLDGYRANPGREGSPVELWIAFAGVTSHHGGAEPGSCVHRVKLMNYPKLLLEAVCQLLAMH